MVPLEGGEYAWFADLLRVGPEHLGGVLDCSRNDIVVELSFENTVRYHQIRLAGQVTFEVAEDSQSRGSIGRSDALFGNSW